MTKTSFKVSFTLDSEDAAYFRERFRAARKAAGSQDPDEILAGARNLVESVKRTKKTPKFVLAAIASLEDLIRIIEDRDYAAPKIVVSQVLGALAYFSNPHDMIPDEVPVLGFLDDAIMIKFVEQEFKHEIAAFRKFCRFRSGAEQRPWTNVAARRLPGRLEAERKKLREEVDRRKRIDQEKGRVSF